MEKVADDTIRGAPAIAEFTGESVRYHLCENGMIPCGKQGAIWIASKRALREHYDRLTAGEPA